MKRALVIAIATSLLLTLEATKLTSPSNAQSPGLPASCEQFRVKYAIGEAGASVNWVLDAKNCYFAHAIDVIIDTYEDNELRDHYELKTSTLNGTTVRNVRLKKKPPCSSSIIRINAHYGDSAIGDDTSTQGRIYYDPNDNCGA